VILKETIAENRLKKCMNWASKSEISNEQKNEDQNLLMITFIEKIMSEIAINILIKDSNVSLNFIHYWLKVSVNLKKAFVTETSVELR